MRVPSAATVRWMTEAAKLCVGRPMILSSTSMAALRRVASPGLARVFLMTWIIVSRASSP